MTLRGIRRWLRRVLVATTAAAAVSLAVLAVLWHAYPFPMERLDALPASPVVTDRGGTCLLQLTAADEQWRFPVPLERVSPWLLKATIAAEDKRFYEHPGVDSAAAARALLQNLSAGRTVSGASTLTMQICRMMDARPRTLWSKSVEAFRAVQLESRLSKADVLCAYLNRAPYGRNFCGVEAASQAYFGCSASQLSLAQSALLAGLPQSPARFRPDRRPAAAMARRQYVLDRMLALGYITPGEYRCAADEPLAIRSSEPDRSALHAAQLALSQRPGGGRTTIDLALQQEVVRLVRAHVPSLPPQSDVSVVVIDLAGGEIRCLVGSADPDDPNGGQVCGATAWRSPGSALKPFVYAAAFEAARADANTLVYDVPIERSGWAPHNFDGTFRGPVTVAAALRDSLNVPAILVAEQMGMERCAGLMTAAGVAFRDRPAQNLGLAMVVGGAEVRLLDLTNAYATIGRGGVYRPAVLFADSGVGEHGRDAHATKPAGGMATPVVSGSPWACHKTGEHGRDAHATQTEHGRDAHATQTRAMDANVCAALDAILSTRNRCPAGMEDRLGDAIPWFMWKTGTSSGRRDAWALGHNGRFAVGVWVGRFSGGGSGGFVGALAAEALLATIFDSPLVRSTRPTAAARPWVVMHPLDRPAEAAAPVHIVYPAQGATFVTIAGQAVINARVNQDRELHWFLDSHLLPQRQAPRLTLPAGRYELRCVTAEGQASAVTFHVQ
ncbi:MAG: transglycosylase domain-containing protein [Planctomycetaceae bacterium]|nr:transglycosylase domain-containing protein [Planctomycetaceae bacterium]